MREDDYTATAHKRLLVSEAALVESFSYRAPNATQELLKHTL